MTSCHRHEWVPIPQDILIYNPNDTLVIQYNNLININNNDIETFIDTLLPNKEIIYLYYNNVWEDVAHRSSYYSYDSDRDDFIIQKINGDDKFKIFYFTTIAYNDKYYELPTNINTKIYKKTIELPFSVDIIINLVQQQYPSKIIIFDDYEQHKIAGSTFIDNRIELTKTPVITVQ